MQKTEAFAKGKTTAVNMTTGAIAPRMIFFALPLLFGNLFQMLYNTVDVLVVGNFVGTEALAAVGSTSMIINTLVFFFNGVSTGAGVLISRHFGAREQKRLHLDVETAMGMTFLFGVLFTIIGVLGVGPMLRLMATPDDVMESAAVYLRIYFLGISGLLIYNMGNGILSAVGDTKRPLFFLIFCSICNIILDLFFVLVLRLGIRGVAFATILSQFFSAFLVLRLLIKTKDIYRFSFRDLTIDKAIFKEILSLGLPAGIQATLTSISNVFVQSYVNVFGSACMAGWSCYNKLDQFILLPMSSMAQANTTFVSQNLGAGYKKRARKGAMTGVGITVGITLFTATILFLFAKPATACFSSDAEVVRYGVRFLRLSVFFLTANCINHVLAGAIRGYGDAKAPMVIMLFAFVLVRQVYLFVGTRMFPGTELVVGLAYPVGWVVCAVIEVSYFLIVYGKKNDPEKNEY